MHFFKVTTLPQLVTSIPVILYMDYLYTDGIVPFAQLILLSAVLRPLAELPSITCTQLINHLETSLNLTIAVHDIVAINNATISC